MGRLLGPDDESRSASPRRSSSAARLPDESGEPSPPPCDPPPASEWAATFRDRAFVTHAVAGLSGVAASPRGATLLVDARFSGPALDRSSLVEPDLASAALRAALAHFDGKDLSSAVTAAGSPSTVEVLTKEVWRLVAGARYHGSAADALEVTARESDLLAFRYKAPLPSSPVALPAWAQTATGGAGCAAAEAWTLSVRNQIRAAHSFLGEQFGPCQQLHGITWLVTVDLVGPEAEAVAERKAAVELVDQVSWWTSKSTAGFPSYYKVQGKYRSLKLEPINNSGGKTHTKSQE